MPAIRSHHWPSSLSCSPPERPTERLALSRLLSKFATQPRTQPEDLAHLIADVLSLPNNAAIAELLVNCGREDML